MSVSVRRATTERRAYMLLQLDEAAAVVAQVKAQAGGAAAAATKEATRLTPAIMLRTATIFGLLEFVNEEGDGGGLDSQSFEFLNPRVTGAAK